MPTTTQSQGTAQCCPVCGAPAALMREEDTEAVLARCSGPKCDPEWQPLEVWNSDRLAVVPMSESRSIDRMKRADVPAIVASFLDQAGPLIEKAQALVVTDASQVDLIEEARALRLAIRDMRLAVKGKHKEVKAGLLEQTREVDKLLRVVDRFDAAEAHLKEQEQFVARQEAEDRMRLQQEREDMLRPYIPDEAEFLEATADIAKMPETAFYHLRDGYEAAHVARLKLEREDAAQAEAAAQAERDERARIAAENERLRNEAAEKEAALVKERAKVAKAAAAAEEAARKERLRLQAIADVERQKQAAAHEAELAVQRKAAADAAAVERERQRKELAEAEAEREKVAAAARKGQARLQAIADAAELEAKTIRDAQKAAEAEARRQQEAAAASRDAAAKAPDREKLLTEARTIFGLIEELHEMTSDDARDVQMEMVNRIKALSQWVIEQAEAL